MNPNLLIVLGTITGYCFDHKLPLLITSMKSDAVKEVRVSVSHAEGRAFDVSINGWSEAQIETFKRKFNKDFESVAAVSNSDGKPRLIVDHRAKDAHGNPSIRHFHVQVRRLE